jgi:hypothetical protein
MNKRIAVIAGTILIWLVAVAIIAKVSLDRIGAPSWGNPIGVGLSAEVEGDTRVGQQFTAPWPGLYRIAVALDRATASDAREVTFHLKNDPAASEDLWSTTFSTDDVQNGGWYTFEFPPIRNSGGQAYYFFLESADTAPGGAIAVGYSADAVLDGASAHFNDQPIAGNLQFRTLYSLRTREKVGLLLSQMAEGRPYLLGNRWFYAALAVTYGLVLGVFVLQIAKIILQEQEEQA